VKVSPHINDTTQLKEVPKGGGALPRGVRRVRATTIKGTIKDSVEISSQNSRHRGINLGMEVIQELITSRVAVWTVNTTDTKGFTKKGELTLKKTTIIITPRVDQRQRRTKQNNITTGMSRTRRKNTTKPRRQKPR